jgi:hypothetical protein
MVNTKYKSSNSFFESVAHHNLERFHSETIAWIFKTFPNSAKKFIKSIDTDISSIDKIELNNEYCWAELNQIDILLKYSYNSKNYQIIIENKMKASEHKIEAQKLLKKGKHFDEYSVQLNENEIKFLLNEEVKLSQTEYYYIREKMYREDNIEYCRHVYLKPSKINEEKFKNNNSDLKIDFDFKQLNTWNKQLGKNPWVTITYKQLINTIQESGAIENSEQALERYSKLQIEKKCIEDIIIANSYINFIQDNIQEKVNLDDFNQNEEYARFDYFKLLFALVKTKFEDVSILNSFSDDNKQNSIYEYLEAGSSNGGMPLFAFYKKVKLPMDEKFDFFKPKRESESINIGIQIQGENIKAYVSAEEKYYDSTTINEIKKEDYAKFVRYILNKITENWKRENKLIFTDKEKGFHPNTSKTFYSRSYKIKNFIVNDEQEHRRDIFDIADEISEKVNHFVNHDIRNSIDNYKFNI